LRAPDRTNFRRGPGDFAYRPKHESGDVSIPQNMVVAKEIEMRGTFRFHEEFGLAVDLINQKRVDLTPLLTGVFGLDEANHAFEIAGDRSRSMKVQLSFSSCM
jgi:L-idonate 5-dehydrogenase